MCERSGQPVVISWGKTRESQTSFFHEKTQHDGTAQSVVSGEKPHDRTGQPVVIPQREIRPQQFIIGNNETESELSVESEDDTKWPKSWANIEDPVVPLERKFYGHTFAGLLCEREKDKHTSSASVYIAHCEELQTRCIVGFSQYCGHALAHDDHLLSRGRPKV